MSVIDVLRGKYVCFVFFCQAEDGIRDLVRSRGLGDVYKRQIETEATTLEFIDIDIEFEVAGLPVTQLALEVITHCLLYTSDAADERSSVDLGGRRIIKKKNNEN